MKQKKIVLILCMAASLSGCMRKHELTPSPNDPRFAPGYPQKQKPNSYAGGAIFQPKEYRSIYASGGSHKVGDMLTVILTEKTQGKKRARTTQRRDSDLRFRPRIGTGGLGKDNFNRVYRPELSVDIDADFRGDADSLQSNSLSGTITVSVVRVLNNGNLVIKGEKWITINRGREYIRLSGIVRPQDITDENTVLSSRVGDARIQYSGTGQFSDTNEPGWLSRFFMGL